MASTRRLNIVLFLCFFLGFIITISEPDLQVLAEQVPAVPNHILIIAVACGVGFFLVVSALRMLFSCALSPLLVGFYILVFFMAFQIPEDFLAVAFDSGGVTTGPITVPFIMSLGIGFAAVRSDRHAENDSFGLVALCSIGPILAVLLLGLLYHPSDTGYTPPSLPVIKNSRELWHYFMHGFPKYMKEIAFSLLPIILFSLHFNSLPCGSKRKSCLELRWD